MSMYISTYSFYSSSDVLYESLSTANGVSDMIDTSQAFSASSRNGWIAETINTFSKKIDLTNLSFLNINNANSANFKLEILEEEDDEVYCQYLVFILDDEKNIKARKDLEKLFDFFVNCSLSAEIQSFDFDMTDAQDAIEEVKTLDGLARCLDVEREYTNPYYFLGFLTMIDKLLQDATSKNSSFIHVIVDML